MKIWKTKYRHLVILPMVLVFAVIPFLDSMACDDLAGSAPSPGSGLEIRCKDLAKLDKSQSESDADPDDQPSTGCNVHVLCPICFTIAETACSYNFQIFLLTAAWRPELLRISFAALASPIDKPPQNY
jgi:hypothetical protein